MCPKQLCYRFCNRDEFALEGDLDYRLVQASALAANRYQLNKPKFDEQRFSKDL